MKKLIERFKTFLNQRKSIPNDYPFVMYSEEKELLKKYLSNAQNYLEFGTGGSTLFSLINSSVNITSVDTNLPWISFIKKYKIIKDNLGKRLHIHFIDIGPTKYWGYPVNQEYKENFPNFSSEIFEKESDFDLVLVDGRFRVACTLQTILHSTENKNPIIMIHDYSLRNEYKVVENFLDLVEKEKTLFIFKLKENINVDEVRKYYEDYKYIAD